MNTAQQKDCFSMNFIRDLQARRTESLRIATVRRDLIANLDRRPFPTLDLLNGIETLKRYHLAAEQEAFRQRELRNECLAKLSPIENQGG